MSEEVEEDAGVECDYCGLALAVSFYCTIWWQH